MIRLLHTCSGHRAALYALAPAGAEGCFYSAGGDGWVVLWDAADPETGRLVSDVGTQVFSLYYLPDAARIVAGDMNGGIHWINLSEAAQTRSIQAHQKGVYALQAAGDSLYSAGGDGVLTRWNISTQRSVESLRLSNRALRCIAFSSVRQELAVGSSDGALYILDAATLEVKRRMAAAHEPTVFSAAYAPDGKRLLSGGRDARLKVWDTQSDFQLVLDEAAHWFTINHIAFSPSGTLFATAGRDKTLKIWDAASLQLRKVADAARYGAHLNSVNRALWLNENILASCSDDRSVALWQIAGNQDFYIKTQEP